MVTLASANLPEESDPEDEDYEGVDSEKEGNPQSPRKEASDRAAEKEREQAASQAWTEMHKEAMSAARHRPPCAQLDPLLRQLQRRHPRPPKQCSRKVVLAEVAKYCSSTAASPAPSAAEIKKQVRSAAAAAAAIVGDETNEASKVAVRPRSVVVEDLVRFAGECIKVRRSVPVGSAEEQRRALAQKRRRHSELGGQLAGLDALLGNSGATRAVSVVEKSDIDWQKHKEEAGIRDLERDPHSGALDRRAFLARASERSAAASVRSVAARR